MCTIGFKHAREVALVLQPQERAALLHDLRVSLDEPWSEAAVVEAVADRWADLYASVCMCEIAQLAVADTLSEESMSAAELAQAVGAHPDALRRAMRLVASYGVFVETPDGRFQHSPTSRVMRSSHPRSQRDWLRLARTKLAFGILQGLGHSLRSGRPAAEFAAPEGVFAYLAAHPEEGSLFDRSMTARSRKDIAEVVRAYDFSGFASIADIGGGQGHLLRAVLEVSPHARGVLFDLPHSIEAARRFGWEGVTLRAGSFFEDALPTCDAYLLKNVIHDWSDEEAIRILKAVHRAAPADATVLLVEAELPSGPERHPSKALDILMLAWTTGRERTASEYRAVTECRRFPAAPCSSSRTRGEHIRGEAGLKVRSRSKTARRVSRQPTPIAPTRALRICTNRGRGRVPGRIRENRQLTSNQTGPGTGHAALLPGTHPRKTLGGT